MTFNGSTLTPPPDDGGDEDLRAARQEDAGSEGKEPEGLTFEDVARAVKQLREKLARAPLDEPPQAFSPHANIIEIHTRHCLLDSQAHLHSPAPGLFCAHGPAADVEDGVGGLEPVAEQIIIGIWSRAPGVESVGVDRYRVVVQKGSLFGAEEVLEAAQREVEAVIGAYVDAEGVEELERLASLEGEG